MTLIRTIVFTRRYSILEIFSDIRICKRFLFHFLSLKAFFNTRAETHLLVGYYWPRILQLFNQWWQNFVNQS
jgi:hypothetical protein